jgi:hypothetical protein
MKLRRGKETITNVNHICIQCKTLKNYKSGKNIVIKDLKDIDNKQKISSQSDSCSQTDNLMIVILEQRQLEVSSLSFGTQSTSSDQISEFNVSVGTQTTFSDQISEFRIKINCMSQKFDVILHKLSAIEQFVKLNK